MRPVDFKHGRVDMTHGSGGRAMAQLIEELFARAFANEWLAQGNDMAREGNPGAARRDWGMAESIVGAANSGKGNCRIHPVTSAAATPTAAISTVMISAGAAGYPAGTAYLMRSGPV